MSSSYSSLHFEVDEKGMALLTINRPDKLNALNDLVLNELAEAFKKVSISDDIRGVILRGSGDKAFVAGADIGELQNLNERSGRMASQKGQQIFQSVEDTRKPVIAAVNGYALGGGAELAMACHIRVAGQNAVFGLPELGLGIIPGYGGTQRLAHIVGKGRAAELILTGRHVEADEAHRLGLVNTVAKDPVSEAEKMLEKIFEKAPLAVRDALNAIYHSDTKNGYQVEADLFGHLCDSEDFKEGTAAFMDKRAPKFKGQ